MLYHIMPCVCRNQPTPYDNIITTSVILWCKHLPIPCILCVTQSGMCGGLRVLSRMDCLDHKHRGIHRRCYIAITYREYPLSKHSDWSKIRHCASCKISMFDQRGLIVAGQSIKYWEFSGSLRMIHCWDIVTFIDIVTSIDIVTCRHCYM